VRVHHDLTPEPGARPLVLAIGFFDGVHRGHREILRALLRLRRPGERTGVLTFRNHPASFLRPGTEPSLITTLEERVALLGNSGVDDLYLLPFDAAIAGLSAAEFVGRILVETLRVRALAVGENFRFGNGRAGDAALARTLFEPRGSVVVAVPPVMDGAERVSSTRIRAALARGDVGAADALLGAPYTVRGTVVLGEGRGHALGFPTANLALPPQKTLPMDGVYAMSARHDGRDYRGLVSIGDKPTFGGGEKAIEAWLRDFSGTIYGEELSVRDFRFVREQRAFDSVDELVLQMQEDATHVRFPSFALI
jgi:riboflavin kinase / FMN adenylyltransferase